MFQKSNSFLVLLDQFTIRSECLSDCLNYFFYFALILNFYTRQHRYLWFDSNFLTDKLDKQRNGRRSKIAHLLPGQIIFSLIFSKQMITHWEVLITVKLVAWISVNRSQQNSVIFGQVVSSRVMLPSSLPSEASNPSLKENVHTL